MNLYKTPKHICDLAKSKFRHIQYQRCWGGAAPIPYKIIRISPGIITHATAPPLHRSYSLFGTYIIGGDWDQPKQSIDERGIIPFEQWSDTYRSVRDYFKSGANWEDTIKHQKDICNRSEEFSYKRKKKLESLYDSINSNRYKQQSDLESNYKWYIRYGVLPPEFHEVTVNIGRDGQFIFEDGKHRLSIAKIQEVDSIPVRILARHERWQQIRCEIRNASQYSELSEKAKEHVDHPDIVF